MSKGVLLRLPICVLSFLFFLFFSPNTVYIDLNVVFIIGVLFLYKSINTGGMSITLLIEQNVYRYYALTEHTLSHYCLQDIKVFPLRVASRSLAFCFLFFSVLFCFFRMVLAPPLFPFL